MDYKFTFTEKEVNAILNALAERPYYEVYELIGKIQTEAHEQMAEREVKK